MELPEMEETDLSVQTLSDEGFDEADSVMFDIASEEFSTDDFRMHSFKIRRCPKQKPHDWTQCPFAHCGERATRRDPRVFSYLGSACAEFRRSGTCSRGDQCSYAHGVFECWLHPSKYKTQMCSDVKNCKRPVCFFAHHPSELRAPTGINKVADPVASKPSSRSSVDVPSLRKISSGNSATMNVEVIAAEVEKLLGQKAASSAPLPAPPSTTPPKGSQNVISNFLNAVVQLQQTVPGINVMQLVQAVMGSQQQGAPLAPAPPPPPPPSGTAPGVGTQHLDVSNLLMQAQLQAQLQSMQAQAHLNVDYLRQSSGGSWTSKGAHTYVPPDGHDNDNTGDLSGALSNYDGAFSPASGSLGAHSGPFSTGPLLSGTHVPSSHASRPPYQDPPMAHYAERPTPHHGGSGHGGRSSAGHACPLATFQSNTCGTATDPHSVDWSHLAIASAGPSSNGDAIGNSLRLQQLSVSGMLEHSPGSAEQPCNAHSGDFNMWSANNRVWRGAAGASLDGGADPSHVLRSVKSDVQRPRPYRMPHVDSLLDALPRDLTELKLSDVANNLAAQ